MNVYFGDRPLENGTHILYVFRLNFSTCSLQLMEVCNIGTVRLYKVKETIRQFRKAMSQRYVGFSKVLGYGLLNTFVEKPVLTRLGSHLVTLMTQKIYGAQSSVLFLGAFDLSYCTLLGADYAEVTESPGPGDDYQ